MVTPQGGQIEEITVIQDTRELKDALRKRKKWAMQMLLNVFCFLCIIIAAGAIIWKIFDNKQISI